MIGPVDVYEVFEVSESSEGLAIGWYFKFARDDARGPYETADDARDAADVFEDGG